MLHTSDWISFAAAINQSTTDTRLWPWALIHGPKIVTHIWMPQAVSSWCTEFDDLSNNPFDYHAEMHIYGETDRCWLSPMLYPCSTVWSWLTNIITVTTVHDINTDICRLSKLITHVWSQLHWTLVIQLCLFIPPSLSVNSGQHYTSSILLHSTQPFYVIKIKNLSTYNIYKFC